MKIFISWSGTKSHRMAEALRDWLPNVIQSLEPWISSSDIDKGARWSSDIASELERATVGIICLTSDNLTAPWILFEAGALSKTLENTFVCPYLLDIDPTEIKGPLVQFQATKAEQEDTRKLIQTINRAQGPTAIPENRIDNAFDRWWPDLEQRLANIPNTKTHTVQQRSDRGILEEVLELVRSQARDESRTLETISKVIPTTTPRREMIILTFEAHQLTAEANETMKRLESNLPNTDTRTTIREGQQLLDRMHEFKTALDNITSTNELSRSQLLEARKIVDTVTTSHSDLSKKLTQATWKLIDKPIDE